MNSDPRIAATGLLVAILALVVSIRSCQVAGRANDLVLSAMQLHLEPEVECVLEGIEGETGLHGFLFTVRNKSAVPALSLSVDHATAIWLEGAGLVSIHPQDDKVVPAGSRWIFDSRLEPNESVTKEADVTFGHRLGLAWFKLSYLREADGRQYLKDCIFYRADGRWWSSVEFTDDPHYDRLQDGLTYSMEHFPTPDEELVRD